MPIITTTDMKSHLELRWQFSKCTNLSYSPRHSRDSGNPVRGVCRAQDSLQARSTSRRWIPDQVGNDEVGGAGATANPRLAIYSGFRRLLTKSTKLTTSAIVIPATAGIQCEASAERKTPFRRAGLRTSGVQIKSGMTQWMW